MTEEQYLNNLKVELEMTKNFCLTSVNLKSIFNDEFFRIIHKQIEALKNNKWSRVHPLWNLMLRSEPTNKFQKLKILDEYLNLIFGHPKTQKKDIKYISEELVSTAEANSLNILFEISISGILLKCFDRNRIVLYPKTVNGRNVDIAIELTKRLVYLEATVIGEAKKDHDKRIEMTNMGKSSWGDWRDINQDTNRMILKLKNKSEQMMEGKPNVLVLGKYDIYPRQLNIQQAIQENYFSKIGTIMQFSRVKLETIFRDGLDRNCLLQENEEKILLDIFNDKYIPLIYN